MRQVLVVDAANVVGSVPNGWWRDRAGAARRLVASLSDHDWDLVVVVLEGAARKGAEPTSGARTRVVHAPGSGDDELVAQCRSLCAPGTAVTLCTADRGLRERVRGLGVHLVGPRQVHQPPGAAAG